MYMSYINSNKSEWKGKKTMNVIFQWNGGLLKGWMDFTSCILFMSVTSEQNTTSKGHLALKKATISREYDVHSFEHQKSFMNFRINVEHGCLYFSKDLWNQFDLLSLNQCMKAAALF